MKISINVCVCDVCGGVGDVTTYASNKFDAPQFQLCDKCIFEIEEHKRKYSVVADVERNYILNRIKKLGGKDNAT